MRLALHKLLARPSVEIVLRSTVRSDCARLCQHDSISPTTRRHSRQYTSRKSEEEQLIGSDTKAFRIRKVAPATKDERHDRRANEPSWHDASKADAALLNAQEKESVEGRSLSPSTAQPDLQIVTVTQRDSCKSAADWRKRQRLPTRAQGPNEGWRSRLVSLEQYQHESNLEKLTFRPRLIDNPSYAQDWELWLDLIVYRRRHHGAKGTIPLYKKIFGRQDLWLPTHGVVADQLWDLLIRAGFDDSELLEEILVYANRLKFVTGRSWSSIYYGIVSVILKKDPSSAYTWHVKLRDDFSGSLEDCQKLFKLSVDWGRSMHFESLYLDNPLKGMYKTVIGHLCERQMYAEALRWHTLLCEGGDFPAEFNDIRPLLDHLVYTGDKARLECIIRQMAEAKVGNWITADDLDETDPAISREIMNRQLGQVHGVAPKALSDGFCARLFATQLFAVETVINGLQMMAVEVIGPLSLREIAVRDNCDPGAICHHIDCLKNADISLDGSAFCKIVRSLAVENKQGILDSIINCDLHPDAFADYDLQERLLAQYYEEKDVVKIERTLTALSTGSKTGSLELVRMNLVLRCLVTLGRRDKVLAMLEEMKHMSIPVSPRSSRHLRYCWLSRRQAGRGPQQTEELTILIQASQMTMQSGRYVPIIAWREILRRLGMSARLQEFENLALWLVDWYSGPAAKASLQRNMLLSSNSRRKFLQSHLPPGRSRIRHPKRYLNTLFTVSAQHAIVAWGFQHMKEHDKSFRRFKDESIALGAPQLEGVARYRWTWGLHLLYKLRARGVRIERSKVARMCRHRLNILFGPGLSKRKINRIARKRMRAVESYTKRVYIRKMEEIWGRGLFGVWRYGDRSRRFRRKQYR